MFKVRIQWGKNFRCIKATPELLSHKSLQRGESEKRKKLLVSKISYNIDMYKSFLELNDLSENSV